MSLRQYKKESGIVLLLAVIVAGLLVVIGVGMARIVIKDIVLSSSGRESQVAFYTADRGFECAIFHDTRTDTFATTSVLGQIACNGESITPVRIIQDIGPYAGAGTTTFWIGNQVGANRCTRVEVAKLYVGEVLTTKIESRGYNTCDQSDFRRAERAVRVRY